MSVWGHVAALAVAGLVVWWLWLSVARFGRAAGAMVAGGFLIRAIVGAALFWTSSLKLPIARSLQVDDGLWFFALDAQTYLGHARQIVKDGLGAWLSVDAVYPSHAYVQILSAAIAAFGEASSVGLLVNLLAYLATCRLVLLIADQNHAAPAPRLVALAAVSFGPSMILWSFQPLKDTVFLFVLVGLIAAFSSWQAAATRAAIDNRRRGLIFAACGMIGSTFVLAGIRWYVAAIAWAAAPVFFVLTAIRARAGWRSVLATACVFVLAVEAFRFGGGADIPLVVRKLIDIRTAPSSWRQPQQISNQLVATRYGFETTPGATTIRFRSRASRQSPLVAARQTPPVNREPVTSPARETGRPAETDATGDRVSPPAPEDRQPAAVMMWAAALAMLLPRGVAGFFGVQIEGGRGLWTFVDIDTLVFDAVLIFALTWCVRQVRQRSVPAPLFLWLFVVLATTTALMTYTINNFGTLFRLRLMIYGLIALLPLTARGGAPAPSQTALRNKAP